MENVYIDWTGFEACAGISFRSLHGESEFADITLACVDD